MDGTTVEGLRRWTVVAIAGLTDALIAAPDASVPAYPGWTNRDLGLHVARIGHNAAIAASGGALERPSPTLGVGRDDEPARIAEAVGEALEQAHAALESCPHELVWTPVGDRSHPFWWRRLLRESVLHRWDAEQAAGRPNPPGDAVALELIDEFLDTDVVRGLAGGERGGSGLLVVEAGGRRWSVDLRDGSPVPSFDAESVEAPGVEGVAARIRGAPADVWLWLVGRDGSPGTVSVEDLDGGGVFFTELIGGFSRPVR